MKMRGMYPLEAPQLSLDNDQEYISLSDGRDLLWDFIDWSPNNTLFDIYTAITGNLRILQDPDIGKFHLGMYIELNTWDKPNMKVFQCVEEDPLTQNSKRQRAFAITHSALLQLELHKQFPELGFLIGVSSFSALAALRRVQEDNDLVVVEWREFGNSSAFAQHFRFQNPEEFIEKVIENIKALGGTAKLRKRPQLKAITEDEVSAERLKRIKIGEIMRQIGILEQQLIKELKYAKIDQLIKLYQQAIEYYSAMNDPKFEILLNKMQDLMKNERVLKIFLNGGDFEEEASPKETGEVFRDRLEDELLEHDYPLTQEKPIEEPNEIS